MAEPTVKKTKTHAYIVYKYVLAYILFMFQKPLKTSLIIAKNLKVFIIISLLKNAILSFLLF